MHYIGIDIGSTGAKAAVISENGELLFTTSIPTGWSSKDAAQRLREQLEEKGLLVENMPCVATGYGRISVPYARKQVTEITCHARGAVWLHQFSDGIVIDIGGQDTKVIRISGGMVQDFLMNDKRSAGTGRFLEVMANAIGMDPAGLCTLSAQGSGVSISSMCTVFAETEIISLISKGEPTENIAFAVVDSITEKVAAQVRRLQTGRLPMYLTGGLCECVELMAALSAKLGVEVTSVPDGRFAGAIGAALCAAGRNL